MLVALSFTGSQANKRFPMILDGPFWPFGRPLGFCTAARVVGVSPDLPGLRRSGVPDGSASNVMGDCCDQTISKDCSRPIEERPIGKTSQQAHERNYRTRSEGVGLALAYHQGGDLARAQARNRGCARLLQRKDTSLSD